jgi:non-ribosomal peptide synthetase-like protein
MTPPLLLDDDQAQTRDSAPAPNAGVPADTLVALLRASATLHPGATALDASDARLDYAGLQLAAGEVAERLNRLGVGAGDAVGVRVPSGTAELYVAILGVLCSGAAYVPVDFDDPPERARRIWKSAGAVAVIGPAVPDPELQGAGLGGFVDGDAGTIGCRLAIDLLATPRGEIRPPRASDDAWVIFTSGSTGEPKGVAITHGSACAFIAAEEELWEVRPGDRVLAGLSVGFDASCEEMWLAWAHGAALVPAPRALVRAGEELGPWLARQRITVVSTVPSLAAIWGEEALAGVRLLILGGEACPEKLGWRLAAGREVWNTYGPTEATVVSTAVRILPGRPVTIGWPLRGWEVVVIDENGMPAKPGEAGELVIAGAGLGRYLDGGLDAERFAPLPALGFARAYRSGDIVRETPDGIAFVGRRDSQVKISGRRLELEEVDALLAGAPGVRAAAAAVRHSDAGNQILVGYVVGEEADPACVRDAVARRLPAGISPLIVVVAELPRSSSGKVDRRALPWPPSAAAQDAGAGGELSQLERWLAQAWREQLGPTAIDRDSDFFELGGTSLAAAKLASALRCRYPTLAVADIYANRRLGRLAGRLRELQPASPGAAGGDGQPQAAGGDGQPQAAGGDGQPQAAGGDGQPQAAGGDGQPQAAEGDGQRQASGADGQPQAARGDGHKQRGAPRSPRALAQSLAHLGAFFLLVVIRAPAWVLGILTIDQIDGRHAGYQLGWPLLIACWVAYFSAPVRGVVVVALRRALLAGLRPGSYPRRGSVALRVWFIDRLAAMLRMDRLAGTPWAATYARLCGHDVGRDAVLGSIPATASLVRIGAGATVAANVDTYGHWIEGDRLIVGEVVIGAKASVGSRCTLMPGAVVGEGAELEPGSVLEGVLPAGERWGGVPARRVGVAGENWPAQDPPPVRHRRRWRAMYLAGLMFEDALALLGAIPALALIFALLPHGYSSLQGWSVQRFAWLMVMLAPALAAIYVVCEALIVALAARLVSRLIEPGWHSAHGRVRWALWFSEGLLPVTQDTLFPLYASLYTRAWLRLAGARIGRRTEVSTVSGLSHLVDVGERSFFADAVALDIGRARGGWVHVQGIRIGQDTFLGNGALVPNGARVGSRCLIGAQTVAPADSGDGTSWLGCPAIELPRRPKQVDAARTINPPARLVAGRAVMDLIRILFPGTVSVLLGAGVLALLDWVLLRGGLAVALVISPLAALAAGILAALVTIAVKWALMGRYRPGEHPLWSFFVWRDEIVNSCQEELAGAWLLDDALGTPLMSAYLRLAGARVGSDVWCETLTITEFDMVTLGDGCALNRGCVVESHLFHDRVMQIGPCVVGAGATLGPSAAMLPDTTLGEGTSVGAHAIVMRGETLPANSRWHGAPVVPAGAGDQTRWRGKDAPAAAPRRGEGEEAASAAARERLEGERAHPSLGLVQGLGADALADAAQVV